MVIITTIFLVTIFLLTMLVNLVAIVKGTPEQAFSAGVGLILNMIAIVGVLYLASV